MDWATVTKQRTAKAANPASICIVSGTSDDGSAAHETFDRDARVLSDLTGISGEWASVPDDAGDLQSVLCLLMDDQQLSAMQTIATGAGLSVLISG